LVCIRRLQILTKILIVPNFSKEIGLSELITKIKKELESTNKDSPAFFVEKVELELQVTFYKEIAAEAEGKAKADLKVQVLNFDLLKLGELEGSGNVTGNLKHQDVHTIKLTLTPAINLNKEVWERLEPELQNKIKKATPKIVTQGDRDRI
jgi:Trypsin-co-occurring domain 2